MQISNQDRKRFLLAYQAALSSTCRWQLGSVIAYGGAIVAISPNKIRHDGRFIQKHSLHAECAALILAGTKTKGATIYTVRIGKKGDLRMARPCKDCLEELSEAGISRICYSDELGQYQSARVRNL